MGLRACRHMEINNSWLAEVWKSQYFTIKWDNSSCGDDNLMKYRDMRSPELILTKMRWRELKLQDIKLHAVTKNQIKTEICGHQDTIIEKG